MGNENTQVSANLMGIKFITFLLLKLLKKPLNTGECHIIVEDPIL